MERHRETLLALTLLLIITLLLIMFSCDISYAEETYIVHRAILTIYRDGVVHVNVELLVNESEPLIMLPLLSPPERVSNILILDENGSLIDYDISDGNITIYSLGSNRITLEYDTDGLTYKTLGLWTINFTAPFELTLIFPENATIMYLSDIPSAIRMSGSRFEMDLSPGYWEISYEIPIQPPTQPPLQPPTPPDQQQPATRFPTIEYIIAAIAIVCAIILALTMLYRRRRIRALSDEEANVLRFIRERGGRVLEAELRERFPHIPRTSMWRLIKRLEKKGLVRVRKVGLQNLVELK